MTKSRQVADFGAGGFTAGKNKIINGDFGVWQRGTSFTQTWFNAGNTFTADRYNIQWNNVPTSVTVSQQSFTVGTAPVSGYEGQYFYRSLITTVGTCSVWRTRQRIEDVRTFANQIVTVSFWAKADSARSMSVAITQAFGSGGSGDVSATATTTDTFTLTTSWVRYSVTFSVPSISGKTIGTGSSLLLSLTQEVAAGSTLDLWGVQIEANSVATPFTTATGTIQGELAACQRYYWRRTGTQYLGTGSANSATQGDFIIQFPVEMRTAPTMATNSGTAYFKAFMGNTDTTATTIGNFFTTGTLTVNGRITGSGLTTGYATVGFINNASAYLEASSEL